MSVVEQYLLYIASSRVVICRVCQFCITPDGAQKHFQRWHKDVSLTVRKELTHHCSQIDLAGQKDVVDPNNKIVVQGLQLHDGNKCVSIGCNYICAKESTAMVHAREHGWVKGKPRTWMKCYVQVSLLTILT